MKRAWPLSLALMSLIVGGSLATAPEVATLNGHAGAVLQVAFSPDGKLLATGSADKTVKLWDVRTGKLKKTLSGHGAEVGAVAFSPDGKILASGGRAARIVRRPNVEVQSDAGGTGRPGQRHCFLARRQDAGKREAGRHGENVGRRQGACAEADSIDGIKKGDLVYVRYWRRTWVGKGRVPQSTGGHRGLPSAGESIRV
jgi:hypothetical protein